MKPVFHHAALALGAIAILSTLAPASGHAQQRPLKPMGGSIVTDGYNCATAPDGSGRFCATLQQQDVGNGNNAIYAVVSQGGSPVLYSYSAEVDLIGGSNVIHSQSGLFNQTAETTCSVDFPGRSFYASANLTEVINGNAYVNLVNSPSYKVCG